MFMSTTFGIKLLLLFFFPPSRHRRNYYFKYGTVARVSEKNRSQGHGMQAGRATVHTHVF